MRCCGVDISGKDLIVALVDANEGDLRFVPTKPSKISLTDDQNQKLVKSFYNTIDIYLRENEVELIAVKKRPGKGKFAGGPVTFKMEGLLQLAAGCTVSFYAASTVSAKIKKMQLSLPTGVLAYQEHAYFTACCAIVAKSE